jgi:hypothetical protein
MQLLVCCLMLVLEIAIRLSKLKARGTTFDKCRQIKAMQIMCLLWADDFKM